MKGALHHIEIYVKDLNRSKDFWGWLLHALGYKEYQNWEQGISYILEKTYIVFVKVEEKFLDIPYHRCRAGLNHLAFHGGSKEFVDDITLKLRKNGIKILYDNKHPYAGGADYFPITLEENLHKEVEKMALGAYKALKCSVYARIDMIITEDGVPYVLEANTLPGMTSTSLFPQSAAEKGINFTQFLDNIIDTSMRNFK